MFSLSTFPWRSRPKPTRATRRARSSGKPEVSPATMRKRPPTVPELTAVMPRVDYADPSTLGGVDSTIGGTVSMPGRTLPPSQRLYVRDERNNHVPAAPTIAIAPPMREYSSGEYPVDLPVPEEFSRIQQSVVSGWPTVVASRQRITAPWFRDGESDRDRSLARFHEDWTERLGDDDWRIRHSWGSASPKTLVSLTIDHGLFDSPASPLTCKAVPR